MKTLNIIANSSRQIIQTENVNQAILISLFSLDGACKIVDKSINPFNQDGKDFFNQVFNIVEFARRQECNDFVNRFFPSISLKQYNEMMNKIESANLAFHDEEEEEEKILIVGTFIKNILSINSPRYELKEFTQSLILSVVLWKMFDEEIVEEMIDVLSDELQECELTYLVFVDNETECYFSIHN